MKNDSLGDRMKYYEKLNGHKLMPLLPVVARLDGKTFSKFTKGLKKPFDEGLMNLMIDLTKSLVDQTNAIIGYTQSDEITLIWYSDNSKSEIFMGGKSFKMHSLLSAMASVFFTQNIEKYIPEKSGATALFDCRVWNVPNKTEAINTLIWREQDAVRNSISSVAQSQFSHNSLFKKNSSDMQDMLFKEKGINWNDLDSSKKRGTYIRRKTVSVPFTVEEIEKLPLLHNARRNPDLVCSRNVIDKVDMPILTKILNRENVIFDGATPETK